MIMQRFLLIYFALVLSFLSSSCRKADTEGLKEELKAERKKREENAERYKEALAELVEQKKRAENLERLLFSLVERLEGEGKDLPEEVVRFKGKKTKEVKKEGLPTKTLERLVQLGDELYSKAQYAAAKEVYTTAQELGASEPSLYLRLGACLISLGEYPRAVALHQAAAEALEQAAQKEKACQAYNNLGWLYIQQKQYKEAEKAYLRAIKLEPSYANAYYNLGLLYDEHLNDDMGAIECFERYIALKGERATHVEKRLAEIRQR